MTQPTLDYRCSAGSPHCSMATLFLAEAREINVIAFFSTPHSPRHLYLHAEMEEPYLVTDQRIRVRATCILGGGFVYISLDCLASLASPCKRSFLQQQEQPLDHNFELRAYHE
jgi:hypothetical protein